MGGLELVLGVLLMPVPWVRIGALVVFLTLFGTFMYKSGAKSVQADWDKDKINALEVQQQLKEQSEAERKVLNKQVFELQVELESEESKAARINDELQIAINREPVVTTVSVSAGDGCPVVDINIPDVVNHFRLFNCAISNSCETLPDAGEANISDGAVQGADSFTFVDGIYGRDNQDRPF